MKGDGTTPACAGPKATGPLLADLFAGTPAGDDEDEGGNSTVSPADLARQQRAVRALCAVCPLAEREACLRGALQRGESWGVWGGLTTPQFRQLRAQITRRRNARGKAGAAA